MTLPSAAMATVLRRLLWLIEQLTMAVRRGVDATRPCPSTNHNVGTLSSVNTENSQGVLPYNYSGHVR